MTAFLVGATVLIIVVCAVWLIFGDEPADPPVERSRPSVEITAPRSVLKEPAQTRFERPTRISEVSPPRVRALTAILGASEAAAQQEIRRTLAELAQKIDVATTSAGQLLDFHAATQLHRESAKAADLGYMRLGLARKAENLVRASQTDAHDRLDRYGRTREITNELGLLHEQRQLLKLHVQDSKTFLDAYNIQTGELRDRITNEFGENGRRWRRDLEERKKRRNEPNT